VRVPGAQRHGFTITTTEVVFRGTCPECKDQDKRKEVNG
jgi:Fe2+ or Zn2+ uptake regulation protein